jgi:hypothetical protein
MALPRRYAERRLKKNAAAATRISGIPTMPGTFPISSSAPERNASKTRTTDTRSFRTTAASDSWRVYAVRILRSRTSRLADQRVEFSYPAPTRQRS